MQERAEAGKRAEAAKAALQTKVEKLEDAVAPRRLQGMAEARDLAFKHVELYRKMGQHESASTLKKFADFLDAEIAKQGG